MNLPEGAQKHVHNITEIEKIIPQSIKTAYQTLRMMQYECTIIRYCHFVFIVDIADIRRFEGISNRRIY